MADPLYLQLQPASFRGVPFQVDAGGVEAGRRVQVHEYPQRDKPWAEDLGRATRGFTVEGVVVGPDYITQANALIDAAEQAGAGTLVHPWLGSMEVTLREPIRVQFSSALGQATISFSFVEPGELAFPLAVASTPTQSQIAADNLVDASQTEFAEEFDTADTPAFVADAATASLESAVTYATNAVAGGIAALGVWSASIKGSIYALKSLVGLPVVLALSLVDALDLSGLQGAWSALGSTASTLRAAVLQALLGTAGNGGAGGSLNAPRASATATPARIQQVTNTAAINALVRRTLLAQAVGISAQLDTTVQTDALALRDALCNALDLESLLAGDATYQALQAARRAVWADLTTRASGGARVVTLTTSVVQPALVLAYDRFEDASRADELVQRNHVIHPGFVPPQSLKVLSK